MALNENQFKYAFQFIRMWKGNYAGRAALAFIGFAVFAISPGWLGVLLMLLGGATFEQALAQNGPTILAYIIAAVAMVLAVICVLLWTKQSHPSKKSAVIAVRHQSFDGNTHPLTDVDLPLLHQGSLLLYLEIDQCEFTQNGHMQRPTDALARQLSLATKLNMHLSAVKDAAVAYYGKAHIPLVFAAGYAVQSDTPVIHYELDRKTNGWRYLDELTEGPDLGISTAQSGPLVKGGRAAIRVSISFEVGSADVEERLDTPYADFHLRLSKPTIDIVTTRAQVERIAQEFRSLLDQLRSSPETPAEIHVFCSAPMSVVFAMGRRVSPTLNPPVFIHNHNMTSTPRYGWAVQVTGVPIPVAVLPEGQSDKGDVDVQSS